jgi:hypothetical protein
LLACRKLKVSAAATKYRMCLSSMTDSSYLSE